MAATACGVMVANSVASPVSMVDALRLARVANLGDRPNVFEDCAAVCAHPFDVVRLGHHACSHLADIARHLAHVELEPIVERMSEHTPSSVERHCDVAVIGGSGAALRTVGIGGTEAHVLHALSEGMSSAQAQAERRGRSVVERRLRDPSQS